MSEYGNYEWNQEQYNGMDQQSQLPAPQPEKNGKKILKKVGAVALSAILFGGLAGGAFTGVTYMTGALGQSGQHTESRSETEGKNTTLKTAVSSNDGIVDGQSLDVADIAEGAMPSIVAITNKSVQEVQNYFSMFGQGGVQEVESRGSGIIIGKNEEELLIVTNNHVISDASTISVAFIDDQVYEAAVKGTDAENDLAVIAVKLADISEDTMSQIKVAQVGDSDALKVGQQVVAIGNALGYGQSVTTGIISALNRQVDGSEAESGFIQTDAAINPGNSGGALLDMNGNLIGINSAKLASTEVEGMGYAIPLGLASPILEDLMNRTTRTPVSADQAASLGIKATDVDSSVMDAYGIPEGVPVAEVTKGSAAEKAGLQPGYIITKFDGTKITSMSELKNLISCYAAGETVEIVVKVADNGTYVEKTLTVTLDKAENSEGALQRR